MELNQMMNMIDEECKGNEALAKMLKQLFKFERNRPGWYTQKYDDIILECARKDDEHAN